jgi:NAD(P)-dependent dehydrogenase (short-subunit alcohol dehydrogenase family)
MSQRVIAITGGYGALGAAICEAALAAGAKVVVIDYAEQASEPGRQDVFIRDGVNLSDPKAAEAAMTAGAEAFGGIDVLLNIAGGFAWETVEEGSVERWQALHTMNVLTALNASRAALPYLRKSDAGRIVNIGANAALRATAGMGAYAASKAGVHALTQALAEELKDTAITVNAVLPSILDTAANRSDMPQADPSTWVTPADIATIVLFLASEGARAVNGALLPATGKG